MFLKKMLKLNLLKIHECEEGTSCSKNYVERWFKRSNHPVQHEWNDPRDFTLLLNITAGNMIATVCWSQKLTVRELRNSYETVSLIILRYTLFRTRRRCTNGTTESSHNMMEFRFVKWRLYFIGTKGREFVLMAYD